MPGSLLTSVYESSVCNHLKDAPAHNLCLFIRQRAALQRDWGHWNVADAFSLGSELIARFWYNTPFPLKAPDFPQIALITVISVINDTCWLYYSDFPFKKTTNIFVVQHAVMCSNEICSRVYWMISSDGVKNTVIPRYFLEFISIIHLCPCYNGRYLNLYNTNGFRFG